MNRFVGYGVLMIALAAGTLTADLAVRQRDAREQVGPPGQPQAVGAATIKATPLDAFTADRVRRRATKLCVGHDGYAEVWQAGGRRTSAACRDGSVLSW